MALIKCPECHQDVSIKAATCPHCGAPVKKIAQPQAKRGGGAMMLIVMLLGGLCYGAIQAGNALVGSMAKPEAAVTVVYVTETPEPARIANPSVTLDPTNTPKPTTTPSPTSAPLSAVVKANIGNLRDGPATTYSVIGQVNAGNSVEILGRNEDTSWYKARTADGKIGWLSAALIDVPSAEGDIPRVALAWPTAQAKATRAVDTVAADTSLAYRLACIDAGYLVDKGYPTIARFTFLLQELDSKTVENQTQIGDILATGQQLLRGKYGIEVGLLELAEAVNHAIPEEAKRDNLSFAEMLAALIGIMARG